MEASPIGTQTMRMRSAEPSIMPPPPVPFSLCVCDSSIADPCSFSPVILLNFSFPLLSSPLLSSPRPPALLLETKRMFAAQVAKLCAIRAVQVERAHLSSLLNKVRGSAGFVVPLALVGAWMVWPAMGPETKASMGLPVDTSASFPETKYELEEVDKMPVVKS